MPLLVPRYLRPVLTAEKKSHVALREARSLAICPQIVFELVSGHREVRNRKLRLFAQRLVGKTLSFETGDVAGSGKKERTDQPNRGQ